MKFNNHTKLFTQIYENNEWGDNKNSVYKGSSGNGSSILFNKEYIHFMKEFIDTNNVKKVIDLGCGDWQSSHLIYENRDIKYYGYDAYEKIIVNNSKTYPQFTFTHLDILNEIDSIEDSCDLCILKDVLQHWTCNEIKYIMDKLVLKSIKYIIIINCCNQKYDNQDEPIRSRPLSIKYEPLKSYKFKHLFNYNNKEVSLLSL
jgi:SAM-dependent methyltransferase